MDEKRGNRDKVVIVTKGCHPDIRPRVNAAALREDIASSLERLQTDHIDIYMLHRDDPAADMEAVLGELGDNVAKGRIRKIGVSNWDHTRIEKVNALASQLGLEGITVSSPQMCPARQVRDPWGGGCVSVSYDREAENWYEAHPEIPVFAYSCLGHGMFSGKYGTRSLFRLWRSLDRGAREGYWCRENIKRLKTAEDIARSRDCSVAQIAIAWCIGRRYRVLPTVTVSSEKRMRENIEALDIVLTGEELRALELYGR